MNKKIIFISFILILLLFGCNTNKTFKTEINIMLNSFNIVDDNNYVINYELDNKNENFETFRVGVEYSYSDISLNIIDGSSLNNIENSIIIDVTDYSFDNFYFRFYYVYKYKGQHEEKCVMDDIVTIDILDVAKNQESDFAKMIVDTKKEVVSEVSFDYEFMNSKVSNLSNNINIESIKTIDDYITFTISVNDGYKFGNTINIIINNNHISNYKFDNNLLVINIDDLNSKTIKYFEDEFDKKYGDLRNVDSDIILVDSIEECNITWKSSNESIIDKNGKYHKPYFKEKVLLEAILKYNDNTIVKTISVTSSEFKSLDTYIASTYTYRNYNLCDDEYFDTLDIINCSFAKANEDGSITGNTFFNNCLKYILPKAHEKGCYVVMSIAPESSWEYIANPTNKMIDKFATNIVNTINKYGFDGVDIDWEYPTSSQKTWFTSMMKVIFEKVKANNKHHIVSCAIAGGKWQPPRYDLLNSSKYIDYINVMLYGMCSDNGYYQNALYKAQSSNDLKYNVGKTLTSCSFSESVSIFVNDYQVSKEKLILGLAFYGIKQTYDETTKTYKNGKSVLYSSLKSNYLNNPLYTYYFDDRAKVPYLLKNDGTEFISFDDETSIKYKCEYVIDNKLGGIMNWESGCDTSGVLLKAVKTHLKK